MSNAARFLPTHRRRTRTQPALGRPDQLAWRAAQPPSPFIEHGAKTKTMATLLQFMMSCIVRATVSSLNGGTWCVVR